MKYCILAFLSLLSLSVFAENGMPNQEHIIVSGRGFVEKFPDYVEISVSISKTTASLAQSKLQVDRVVRDVIEQSKVVGVLTDDIRASKVYAAPDYDYENNNRVYKGEEVVRRVTVILKDLNSYGELIRRVFSTGVTRIESINFLFSDLEILQNKAIAKAIDNAKLKAIVIASGFSAKVGKVFKISEKAFEENLFYKQELAIMMAPPGTSTSEEPLRIAKKKVFADVYVVFYLKG